MGKANLHPDFRAFFESLNSAGVRYLLVGGYAVNFHGYHRYTQDIDVWVAIDPANRQRVSKALQEFAGLAPSKVPPSGFATPGLAFILGREPVRIDVLTGPAGVEFEACWSRRIEVQLDGVPVSFIALEDLKANKRAVGRTKDLADLDNLPPASPKPPPGRRPHRKRKL